MFRPQILRPKHLTYINMSTFVFQLLLNLVGNIALATSLPVTNSSTGLAARRYLPPYVGIYICNQAHWRGDCHWHEIKPKDRERAGNCISFQQGGGLGSIGPDRGITVGIYLEKACTNIQRSPGDHTQASIIWPITIVSTSTQYFGSLPRTWKRLYWSRIQEAGIVMCCYRRLLHSKIERTA